MKTSMKTTGLFEGKSFKEALEIYFRSVEEARALEAVPLESLNHYQFLVGFSVRKGGFSNEYYLSRSSLWGDSENIVRFFCMSKLLPDLAEAGISTALQLELASMLPESGKYEVVVKDSVKLGGYKAKTETLAGAFQLKKSLEDKIMTESRYNAITEAVFTLRGVGKLVFFPFFSQERFIPYWVVGESTTSEDSYWETVARPFKEMDDIRKYWTFLSEKRPWQGFEYQGKIFTLWSNPSAVGSPRWTELHHNGVPVDLMAAHKEGILEAWASFLGFSSTTA